MGNLLIDDVGAQLGLHRQHGFFEDFDHVVSADRWTKIATDSGTLTVGDAAGGVITLAPSDGTVADNDEVYLHTTAELFLFAAGKPLFVEARIQYAEVNTDDANVLFGLMNAPAANHLQDNGGGPAASYSGAVFFKEDGQTVWTVENSISTTQKTTQLTAANSLDGVAKTAGGASYTVLKIEVIPHGGGSMDISFWIDNILVAKHKDQSYASATEMAVILGAKNGGANNESILCDYIQAWQIR